MPPRNSIDTLNPKQTIIIRPTPSIPRRTPIKRTLTITNNQNCRLTTRDPKAEHSIFLVQAIHLSRGLPLIIDIIGGYRSPLGPASAYDDVSKSRIEEVFFALEAVGIGEGGDEEGEGCEEG